MGSAGHSGWVIRRGARRDSAQGAGLISTRERVFFYDKIDGGYAIECNACPVATIGKGRQA